MKQLLCTLVLCTLVTLLRAQSADQKAILQILHEQTLSWNRGDLEGFMKGYWNNDSLQFVGRNGVTYGYGNTLDNYKKNYSNADLMGALSFKILQVKQLSAEYCFVLGQWALKRKAGDVGGHYTLLFRKIRGSWYIVSDHSS
ncbi:MAG: DUF4440 domain-containing protein [Williamsia sp.]|nr:DUF4440 domain-containing protein [Williamsia sp.]